MSSKPSASTSRTLLENSTLVSQGAEAKVFKAYLHQASVSGTDDGGGPVPVLLKYRFQKQYRHPSLDTSLTRSRIAGEARALIKCLRSGVNVPGIRMVDAASGVLAIEWIEGKSLRHLFPGGAEDDDGSEDIDENADSEDEQEDLLTGFDVSRDLLMTKVGNEIAKMHLADVIHGDLTTSNMMLRQGSKDLVLIDFGLAYMSTLVEDKAVDLYVLERAFSSTHPDSEPLFSSVLEAYRVKMGKHWTAIGKRLDDVRLRGRKRSMVG